MTLRTHGTVQTLEYEIGAQIFAIVTNVFVSVTKGIAMFALIIRSATKRISGN